MSTFVVTAFVAILGADAAGRSLRSLEYPIPMVAADEPESIASLVSLVKANANLSGMFIQDGFQLDSGSPAPAPMAAPGVAMSPGPAPGPALGPALAPAPPPGPEAAPAVIVAASPFAGEEVESTPTQPATSGDEPAFTKRMVGVDYYLLSANAALKQDFEIAAKTVLAAEVGGGLKPGDVTLKLSAGSVIIDAWFANPDGASSLTKSSIRRNLCHNSNLDDELKAAVSKLSGFKDVTNGDVYLEKAVQCGKATSQPQAAVPKQAKPQPPAKKTDDGSCNPACIEGRGVCGDRVCFCKDPYTGPQCEQEVEEDHFRLNWMYVTVILCAVAAVGMVLAECIWKAMKGSDHQQKVGTSVMKKEVWTQKASS
eukprot:TRINITY_DN107547_c0_g1_i1.p1 TRINITY_DN107547_c0_g1~~TRINITY_DN107547_c0_g1_i1.p1  ORF type:complete len:369 (+),score=78.61 TRINITY_DN107547_c0_g1_i1:109-1215(+)